MATKSKKRRPVLKGKPRLLTRRELAAALDVHMQSITRWERDGMPTAKRGSRGRPSLYDKAACLAWKAARDKATESPMGTISLELERARKEHAQALLAEQLHATREGKLLKREDVERTWSAHVAAVRNRLLHLPQSLADQLAREATLGGAAAVETKLREAVIAVLHELAGTAPAAVCAR